MPVTNSAVSVGTARTLLSGNTQDTKLVYVQDGDYDGDTAVYVGGSAVTAANGIKLSKTNTTVFQLNADDSLFAIGSGATSSVRVTTVA
jgi:hypothetical protein